MSLDPTSLPSSKFVKWFKHFTVHGSANVTDDKRTTDRRTTPQRHVTTIENSLH